MAIVLAIILVASIILILSIMGIGGSFFDKLNASIEDRIRVQNAQADPDIKNTGNFAIDTGTRVCDLRLDFVGSVSANSLVVTGGISLWQGSFAFDFITGDLHNINVVEYKWLCPQIGLTQTNWFELMENSWLSYVGNPPIQTFASLEQQNILDGLIDDDIRIWWFFEGTSNNNGKNLIARSEDKLSSPLHDGAFSNFQVIRAGTISPSEFKVTVWLYDLTEDDYSIEFWNPDFPVNNKRVNHHFFIDICKPGTELTPAQLVDLRVGRTGLDRPSTAFPDEPISDEPHETTTTTPTSTTSPPTTDGTVTTTPTKTIPVAQC